MAKAPRLVIRHASPLGTRLLIGAVGLFPLIWPAYQLAPWTIPFGAFSIGIWVIVIGAALLGSALVLYAFLAPNTVLCIFDDSVTVQRSGLRGTDNRQYALSDVKDVFVKTSDWSDGADTYSVRISFRDGPDWISDTFHDKAKARALSDKLSAQLGRSQR